MNEVMNEVMNEDTKRTCAFWLENLAACSKKALHLCELGDQFDTWAVVTYLHLTASPKATPCVQVSDARKLASAVGKTVECDDYRIQFQYDGVLFFQVNK